MKKITFIISFITGSFVTDAQISGIPATPPAPQATQPATRAEKSAAPQKQNVPPPANPVPPVYPGAEPVPVVIPKELVFPAAPPAPTQPGQTEPLTPVESTNQLQPSRPPRDQSSRENIVNGRPAAVIPDNRVNKNDLRAAGTVEQKQQINNSALVFPARTDTARKAIPAPVKKKKGVKRN
jgi:hypothetical protein